MPKWQEYITLSTQAAGLVLQFLVSVIIARYWGASFRGDVALVTLASTLIATIGGMGLSDLIIACRDGTILPGNTGRWAVTGAVQTGLLSLGVVTATALITNSHSALIVSLLFMPILVYIYRLSLAMTFATQNMGWFEGLRVLWPAGSAVACIALSALAPHTHPLLALLIAQAIPVFLIGLRRKYYGLGTMSFRPLWPSAAQASLCRQSVLGSLANSALLRIDLLLVALLLSRSSAGVYAVALSCSEAVLGVTTTFAMYSLRGHSEERRHHAARIRRAMWVGAFLSISLFPIVLFAANHVFPDEFRRLPVAYAMLGPATVALTYMRLEHARNLAASDARPEIKAMMCGAVLMILLDIPLSQYGIAGFAFSSSLAYAAVGLALYTYRRRSGEQRTIAVVKNG